MVSRTLSAPRPSGKAPAPRREFPPAIRKVLNAHQWRVRHAKAITRLIARQLYDMPHGDTDLRILDDLQNATDAVARMLASVEGIAELGDLELMAERARGASHE